MNRFLVIRIFCFSIVLLQTLSSNEVKEKNHTELKQHCVELKRKLQNLQEELKKYSNFFEQEKEKRNKIEIRSEFYRALFKETNEQLITVAVENANLRAQLSIQQSQIDAYRQREENLRHQIIRLRNQLANQEQP